MTNVAVLEHSKFYFENNGTDMNTLVPLSVLPVLSSCKCNYNVRVNPYVLTGKVYVIMVCRT